MVEPRRIFERVLRRGKTHAMRFGSPLALVLALALGSGCGGSAALRAAEAGRFAELRRAIAEAARSGDLDDDEVHDVARAVASGEVRRAAPPAGEDRLRELRACARDVEEALAERAAGADTIAAAAAMILLDAALADVDATRQHAARGAAQGRADAAAAFRAVHARTLVGPSDGALRRQRFLDGDQAVRVAALRAAIAAVDPADRAALLEAARLDPYPLARTVAIRGAAALGGEAVALALRDAWVFADEPAREAIAEAWSSPRLVDAGGRKQLLWVVSTQRGAPAIAAARALASSGGAGAADARGVLERAITSGPTRDRVYAIHVAPLSDPAIRAAVAKAKDDPDEAVAFAALARQLDATAAGERVAAAARLLTIAAGSSTRALLAKGALARAGFRQVAPILARDVASRDDRLREAAGTALVDLGELARAAPLLADAEPHVRTSVACAVLSRR